MSTEKKMTGYSSIDKPWLKYYSEEAINAKLPECTIYEYLWESNKDHLDDIALIYFGKKITYGELFANINKVANALISNGIKEKMLVSVCMASTPEAIYTIYALNKIGAVPDLIDPRTNAEGLEFFLKESNANLLITIDTALLKFLSIKQNTSVKKIISVSPANSLSFLKRILYKLKTKTKSNGSISWNKFIKNSTKATVPSKVNDLAAIVHTGGTTGIPKGVMLSNSAINSIAHQYRVMAQYNRKQKLLDIIPPFASYGLCTSLHMPLSLGVSVILIPKFSPEEFSNLIIKHKPNYIVGVPSFLQGLLHDEKMKDFNLSFLVCVACGGDTMTASYEKELNSFFADHGADIKITKGYGMSEMSATAVTCYGDVNKLTSVGIPMVCNNISIIDPDTNEELSYDNQGEICLYGPGMMIGYFKNKELTEKTIKQHKDGNMWIHTGDLGHISKDGFLYHDGRIKRMIVRYDGFKIYPEAIEKVLSKHNNVSNCAVVKYEKSGIGIMPVAYIEKTENTNIPESELHHQLLESCKNSLAERAVPDKIVFVKKIPLTPIGKIDYRILEKEAEKL